MRIEKVTLTLELQALFSVFIININLCKNYKNLYVTNDGLKLSVSSTFLYFPLKIQITFSKYNNVKNFP